MWRNQITLWNNFIQEGESAASFASKMDSEIFSVV